MAIAFMLQAVCLVLVLTVGRLSGALFTVTLVLVVLHVGRDLLAVPVARRRLLRHAPRDVELRRAVHRRRASRRSSAAASAALLYEQFGSWSACFYGSAVLALIAARHRLRPARLASRPPRGGRSARRRPSSNPGMSSVADHKALAQELAAAYASRSAIDVRPPRAIAGFDLAGAYAVEASSCECGEPAAARPSAAKSASPTRRCGACSSSTRSSGRTCTTTPCTTRTAATRRCRSAGMCSPKIEPEIVFKLKQPLAAGELDAGGRARRRRVARARLRDHRLRVSGLEISAGRFRRRVRPARRARRRRAAARRPLGRSRRSSMQLARFKVRLMKNGELVEEGSGKNSLRSPALCLGELAPAIVRQADAEPLAAGELVSSGTLTTSLPIAPGETWSAEVEGIDLSSLTLRVLG